MCWRRHQAPGPELTGGARADYPGEVAQKHRAELEAGTCRGTGEEKEAAKPAGFVCRSRPTGTREVHLAVRKQLDFEEGAFRVAVRGLRERSRIPGAQVHPRRGLSAPGRGVGGETSSTSGARSMNSGSQGWRAKTSSLPRGRGLDGGVNRRHRSQAPETGEECVPAGVADCRNGTRRRPSVRTQSSERPLLAPRAGERHAETIPCRKDAFGKRAINII